MAFNFHYSTFSRNQSQLDLQVAVDPVESGKILQLCSSLEVKLVAVLTTHYHSDHSGADKSLIWFFVTCQGPRLR